MACNPSNLLFALLIIAACSSLAQASITVGTTVAGVVNVTARVYCTPNGNSNFMLVSRAVENATVTLACNGSRVVLGTGRTNAMGVATITLSGAQANAIDLARCDLSASLSGTACSVLNVGQTLRSALSAVSVLAPVGGIVAGVGSVVGTALGMVENGLWVAVNC